MMKKTFFSFAMAMVIALGMASCGNKADKAEGGDQATEGEKATEQAAAQDDPNTLSTDAFSMPIPEDFELNGKLEYQKKSGQIAIRTKSGVVPTYNFKIEYHPDIKYSARESQVAALKAIDPITVGNVTFKGGWNPDGKHIFLYADLGDKGTAQVDMPKPSGAGGEKYNPDDATVIAKLKELLSTLKFK